MQRRIETEQVIMYYFTNKHACEKAAKKHGKRAESYIDMTGRIRHYFMVEKK